MVTVQEMGSTEGKEEDSMNSSQSEQIQGQKWPHFIRSWHSWRSNNNKRIKKMMNECPARNDAVSE